MFYGGKTVRYDGGDTTETNPIFLKWEKPRAGLFPVCPEVFGGLLFPDLIPKESMEKCLQGQGKM